MKFIATLLPFATAVLAISKRQQCTTPSVRVEWRSLAQDQRDQFHQAIKCLQTKSSNVQGQTLFDRYSSLHVDMYDDIHYVAAFLPWHRYYIQARENSLRECGYQGPTPYWDWTLDSNNMKGSEMFSPTSGFGGNGSPSRNNCVQDGPYGTQAGFSVGYPEERCLERKFTFTSRFSFTNPGQQHSSAAIENIKQDSDFEDFWQALEDGPHGAVHNEVAGDMAASFSPADPLFFLHHNNVDRIWAIWQGRNDTRLHDYHGNTIQGQGVNDGSKYPLASLDDTISIMEIQGMPNITIRNLMDTTSGAFCYVYDK